MTILEKLEGRIDNDIQEECLKPDLKRIVRELLPLRASEYKTQKYCQDYLYTEHKEPAELLPGAIDRDLAPSFRSALLSVIRNFASDKQAAVVLVVSVISRPNLN